MLANVIFEFFPPHILFVVGQKTNLARLRRQKHTEAVSSSARVQFSDQEETRTNSGGPAVDLGERCPSADLPDTRSRETEDEGNSAAPGRATAPCFCWKII
jgi:hypothetical protein